MSSISYPTVTSGLNISLPPSLFIYRFHRLTFLDILSLIWLIFTPDTRTHTLLPHHSFYLSQNVFLLYTLHLKETAVYDFDLIILNCPALLFCRYLLFLFLSSLGFLFIESNLLLNSHFPVVIYLLLHWNLQLYLSLFRHYYIPPSLSNLNNFLSFLHSQSLRSSSTISIYLFFGLPVVIYTIINFIYNTSFLTQNFSHSQNFSFSCLVYYYVLIALF